MSGGNVTSSSLPGTNLSRSAFATQYLAIIFIILTFTVGALVRGRIVPSAEIESDLPVISAENSVKSLRIDDFFSIGEATPRAEKLSALLAFFSNHDLKLVVTTFPQINNEVDSAMLAVSRALSVRHELEEKHPNIDLNLFHSQAAFNETGGHILVAVEVLK